MTLINPEPINRWVPTHRVSKRQISSIQVLRGVAAVSVVAFHTNIILKLPQYGGLDIFTVASSNGWLGVNFFFLLSGFIILYAHAEDLGRADRLPNYIWRRVSRVYPIYWILLTAFVVAAGAGIGYPDFRWEFGQLFSAYSLILVVNEPTLPLKVAWTLLFEVKFYLVFALLLVIPKRLGITLLVGWAIAIVVRNCFHPLPDWGYLLPDWGMLSIWNIYFLLGMFTAWCVDRVSPRCGWPALLLGLAFLGYGCLQGSDMASDILRPTLMGVFGIAFGLIILGAVLVERQRKMVYPGWVMLIGDASYSIYLVHSAVISQLANIHFKLFFGTFPPALVFLGVFFCSVMVGVAVHLLLERPLLQVMRNLGPMQPRKKVLNP